MSASSPLNPPPPSARRSFDVVIVGGGPAGTAAALTLLRYSSLSVAVVEQSDYGRPRVGEAVSPGVRSILEFLGVWEDFLADGHLAAYGTAAAWGGPRPLTRDFLFTGYGDGWLLDRSRFDRMLARKVEESRGGMLLTEASVRAVAGSAEEGFRLDVLQAGAVFEIGARYVIDATGRKASLARRLGAQRRIHDGLLGVVGYVEMASDDMGPQVTLVEAMPDGWWYSAPLPGRRMVAVFMSDVVDVRRRRVQTPAGFIAALAESSLTRERFASGRLYPVIQVRSACSQHLAPLSGPGWIAAGDAAAAFDPLSSMGIGFALSSGSNAARAAHDALTSDGALVAPYGQSILRHFEEYLALRRRFYAIEQRWPERAFWSTRQRVSAEQPAAPAFRT